MLLITGGAGFIGSNLAAALDEAGGDVAVCDTLGETEKWRNLAKRKLADVFPPAELFGWLDSHAGQVEAVFHMGAISSTTETDADRMVETNFRLSKGLWEWAAAHRVPLIYASSAATYGDGAAGFDDDGSPEHLARLRPLNLYGWSKHLFDRWVARQVEKGGPTPPQWAGLKLFNVYGPNEYHKGKMQSVVAQMAPAVAAGEPARLFRSHRADCPDGGQMRDFLHVDDAVGVMRWLLDRPDVSGLFNVGTGKARSFADLAAATMRAVGREPEIVFVDMPEAIRARYQYWTEADITRLRDAGYDAAMTELEDGITAYVRNYLQAPDPYR